MKLYKHTLVSAVLVLTGLGSAQAQLSSTCPIGMALVYTALTHIPFCVGVPSKAMGTGSSSSSAANFSAGSSSRSAASSSAGSSSSSAASFSAGSAAEDYIPVRPLAVTGILSTTPAAATAGTNAVPNNLFTDAQVASYLRDNNLGGKVAGKKAMNAFGVSQTQYAAAQAMLVDSYTKSGKASADAINAAQSAYFSTLTPELQQNNIAWETAQGLHPELQALYGRTYTDQQVANFIQANGAQGAQQATSMLGVTPEQLAAAQSLLTSGNTVTGILSTTPAAATAGTNAVPNNLFTDAQVASYLRDNNLGGKVAGKKAMNAFGVSQTQYAAAQAMLVDSYTKSGKASADAINAAQSAYFSTLTPELQQNNIAWETAQGLHPELQALYGRTYTNEYVAAYLRNNNLSGAAAQNAMDVLGVSPKQYADAQTMLAISQGQGEFGTTGLAKFYTDAMNAADSQPPKHPQAPTAAPTQAPTQNGALTYTNEYVAAYLRNNNLSGAAAQNAMDVLGVSPKQYADAQTMLAISQGQGEFGTTGLAKFYTDAMNAADSQPPKYPIK